MAVGTSAGELRELTNEELTDKLRESKEELFNLRFQMATGQLEKNHALGRVRREIARIYTVLNERELGLSAGPAPRARCDRRRPRPCAEPRRVLRAHGRLHPMQPDRSEAVVQAERQRPGGHPAAGDHAVHPVPDPGRSQRPVRHVPDGQLTAQRSVELDHVGQHPAQPGLRAHTAQQRRPGAAGMPLLPADVDAGLPRLECGLVVDADPAPLDAVAQPRRTQSDETGRHPQRPDRQRPARVQ